MTTLLRSAPPRGLVTVTPLKEWCEKRHVSKATAKRLNRAGKLRFTYLSKRIIGIRSDDDEAYLDACRDGE